MMTNAPLPNGGLSNPELCRALIECNPDCVKVLTLDGRLELMNQSGLCAMEIADFSAIAGAEWVGLWPLDEQHKPQAALAGALRDGQARFHGYCPTASGAPRWWDVAVSMVRDAQGQPWRLLSISRDISSIRALEDELQAQEKRLRHLITRSHEAIVTTNANGVIVGWNDHAQAVFGWSPDEALGQPAAELLIPGHDQEGSSDQTGRLLGVAAASQTGVLHEFTARTKRGEQIRIEAAVGAVAVADGWEFTGLMHDVSQRAARTELFENAFQHAAVGKALVSLEGKFLKVNKAFCDLLGRTEEGMLTLDFQSITHPGDLDADLEQMRELSAGAIPNYNLDKRYIRPDGQHVWAHLTVSLLRDRFGAPKNFVAQVQDLTARRQAEAAVRESEMRYRLMANHMTDVIVVTEVGGVTTFATPSCEAITGYRPEELVGARAVDFAHPDDVDRLVRAFRRLTSPSAKGERVRWRARHKTEDRWVWLESNPSLLDWTGPAGERFYVDIMRDVTAQVAQEGALADATAAAEAAATAKSEFLANMSHEIRTPLTAILGFCDLLKRRSDLTGDARTHVARIGASGEALLAIVNDVLDFSKLEAGQFAIHPTVVSPKQHVQDVLEMFGPQAESKGIRLELLVAGPFPEWVELDPDRVRQILLNLISNAVKFTDSGGLVSVALRFDSVTECLRFEVTDTGHGMDNEQQGKLFQRFSQVDGSSTRQHGGTGLGLAICKGIVEAMHGEIGLWSQVGEGSTFYVELRTPMAGAPASSGAQPSMAPDLEGIRLLVVDDNATNREFVHAMLKPLGVEVSDAADGLHGVEAARALPYDVILMDVRMPGLDGPAALRRIRTESGPNQFVPILAFSATGDGEAPLVAGFDGVVHKPINPEAMVQAITKAVDWDAALTLEGASAVNF